MANFVLQYLFALMKWNISKAIDREMLVLKARFSLIGLGTSYVANKKKL